MLRLIRYVPEVRAGDLAPMGQETLAFKRDVRKLKELGLTESLEVGYRLSARWCRPRASRSSAPGLARFPPVASGAGRQRRSSSTRASRRTTSKTYWQENKAVYEEMVRRRWTSSSPSLAPEYGEGRIFRPYRDVRFSKDKSPYKTAIAATRANGGYISSAEGRRGRGCTPAPDQLDRYRQAVADDRSGRQLEQIVPSCARAASRSTPTTC